MIRSMTGFGRAELASDTMSITIEARSVNHRHLDIGLRLPNTFSGFESDIRRTVQARLERGRLGQMAGRAPGAGARREERLRERMTALLAGTSLDEARIATEVAVWATKTDVTEELARLRVHLEEFGLMLDKGGSVGRQLDFLIQEMNREVNTIGSKADDLELSQAALAAKGLLEKIREQVQN